ncbi:hypothetical protein BLOT_013561 [Blomia tropicalis]|nr:hypothetical protein BLOT_013561 [Blomia tropicalis]
MVSPLFPSLTPRYVDEFWFNFEMPFDEDLALNALESDYRNLIQEIENRDQRYNQNIPTTEIVENNEEEDDNEDEEDEEEDDDEDDDDDNDDDDEFEDDEGPLNYLSNQRANI